MGLFLIYKQLRSKSNTLQPSHTHRGSALIGVFSFPFFFLIFVHCPVWLDSGEHQFELLADVSDGRAKEQAEEGEGEWDTQSSR